MNSQLQPLPVNDQVINGEDQDTIFLSSRDINSGVSGPEYVQYAAVEEERVRTFLEVIEEKCLDVDGQSNEWSVKATSPWWITVHNATSTYPKQGWKLHISATIHSATDVLRRSLPILLAEQVTFKVAASRDVVGRLNEGQMGLSQVGKFITVYPADDVQAVSLAGRLDQATQGLPGPRVPSDRQLSPSSLVHYRYGAFEETLVQDSIGLFTRVVSTPTGELVPDRRELTYYVPDWVEDPFVAGGLVHELEPTSPLIQGRFLVVSQLQKSPRGTISLAVDLQAKRRCVLKRAFRNATLDSDGRDAVARLRHEAEVLAYLAQEVRFPKLFDLLEHDTDLVLAMEDIEGETLEAYLFPIVGKGLLLSQEEIIAWGTELASTLKALHARGLVYGDLKSNNIIVSREGTLRLVDFELTYEAGSPLRSGGRGTRGYISPQQAAGEPPDFRDDIYALGAILYFLATGVEPSQSSNPFDLMRRPIRILNKNVRPRLAQIIARCLEPDAANRFSTMQELIDELDQARTETPGTNASTDLDVGETAAQNYRELARRLGDTLCEAARETSDPPGKAWPSAHPVGAGLNSRDINTGSAGALLALAELVEAFGDPRHREVLELGARWLTETRSLSREPLGGLYVGESGIGVALLRAGQVLSDADLIRKAAQRGRWIATLPYGSPELFNGSAGRLRFHLWLWSQTEDKEHLLDSIAAGRTILSSAQSVTPGMVRWVIPPGHGTLSGQAYLGYAHGAAGIADALLDLYEATGDQSFLETSISAGRWIAKHSVEVLDDHSGLNWPITEGKTPGGAFWCHGAAGIGRFFLHAAELGVLPGADELAMRAANTVAHSWLAAGATQCHGLSGNIEFLIDMYQVTGEVKYLDHAHILGMLLQALAKENGETLLWPSESGAVFSPDYMVGYAGVALCLLRLGNPELVPHQLSCKAFRMYKRAVS